MVKNRKIVLKRQRLPGIDSVLEWVWCRGGDRRGLIYLPPLIGGNGAEQIRYFRPLLRHGYDLVSFTYAGHGVSGGRFSLAVTLRNATTILNRVMQLTREASLPLFGVGCCYSAIPLLHSASQCGEPFEKLVLINAVTRIDPLPVIGAFVAYYREMAARHRSRPRLTEALGSYLDLLFPGVMKSRRTFGVLDYHRLHLPALLCETVRFAPLARHCMEKTDVLCLHSRRDPVLNLFHSHSTSRYRNDIRSICPRVDFRIFDTDHFFSTPWARARLRSDIVSFFDAAAGRGAKREKREG